jgi:hypothetical protein
VKNAERAGKQELLLAQRNAANEKKKLEGTIAKLESRISVLEDVINDLSDPEGTEVASRKTLASSTVSPARNNLAIEMSDDDEANALNATSADGDSPVRSPVNHESTSFAHEDNQSPVSPAEAEISPQLK